MYDQLYLQLHGQRPLDKVSMSTSDADIISEGRGFMEAFDYTAQLQVGCPAGCAFCYVATGFRLAPADVQRNWGFDVRNKRDIATKLRRHLASRKLADRTIYWSGVTDPYAAAPSMTRRWWETLLEAATRDRPRRIAVQTRFQPSRDAELIQQYDESTCPSDGGPAVVVSYSVGTDCEDLIRTWERATPSFATRMDGIAKLRQAGIWVVPTLSPFGVWKDLPGTLKRFASLDIPYVTVLFFKERTGATTTPKLFLAHLRHHHPELLDPVWQAERLAEIQSIYPDARVGKAGFATLTSPHTVCTSASIKSR